MSKKLLKGDRDQLGLYIRDMADMLGLRDWTFFHSYDAPDNSGAGADCHVTFGQKHAKLRFQSDWPTWKADELRHVVVHELLHCHLWTVDQRFCDLKPLIGESAYLVAETAHREALELAIDGMAVEWAQLLPLPIKAKEPKEEKAA